MGKGKKTASGEVVELKTRSEGLRTEFKKHIPCESFTIPCWRVAYTQNISVCLENRFLVFFVTVLRYRKSLRLSTLEDKFRWK